MEFRVCRTAGQLKSLGAGRQTIALIHALHKFALLLRQLAQAVEDHLLQFRLFDGLARLGVANVVVLGQGIGIPSGDQTSPMKIVLGVLGDFEEPSPEVGPRFEALQFL